MFDGNRTIQVDIKYKFQFAIAAHTEPGFVKSLNM